MKVIPLRGMSIDSVHFSNYGDTTALVVKPKEEKGAFIVDIPNILLQDDRNVMVYSVNISEDKTETIRECVFPVRKRAKPSDYIYTETEVFTYKALEERLKMLEESGATAEQISEAVKSYLEQNPVKESDPSVSEWAKQPEKPKYSADEVGALSQDALQEGVNQALREAKDSGIFDGRDGDDYILTDADKQEIAGMIPVPDAPEAPESSCTAFSVKTYGAIGDGVADDTEAIQTALEACHANGGGTVIIPTGTYLLSDAVKFHSNQRIVGEPGAVLLQKDGSFNNLMRNYYNGSGGYDATANVILEGLTFDGGTQEATATSLLAICHSQNIVVKDCLFRNGYSYDTQTATFNGHDVEINSSKDVLLDRCRFDGNRRTNADSELIQVDAAYPKEAYPWEPDEGGENYDKTISRDVCIRHCIFNGNVMEEHTEGQVSEKYNVNVGIGGHSVFICESVIVEDCVFEDLVYGVRFTKMKNMLTKGNVFRRSGYGVYTRSDADGGYTEDVMCVGNVLEDCTRAYPSSRIKGFGNVMNGEPVEQPEIQGGGTVDLTGYATEDFVAEAINTALGTVEADLEALL